MQYAVPIMAMRLRQGADFVIVAIDEYQFLAFGRYDLVSMLRHA